MKSKNFKNGVTVECKITGNTYRVMRRIAKSCTIRCIEQQWGVPVGTVLYYADPKQFRKVRGGSLSEERV